MLRDKIQKEALAVWLDKGKVGTCEMITGLGKTFVGLHALHSMPKDDKIHLFLAETTSREKDLIENVEKYDKIFNTNTFKTYKVEFYCYQTVYKWKGKAFGLVIADEIHDGLSPEYSKFFFNNKYDALIGLTATVTRDTIYEDSLTGVKYTKGKLLDAIAPVVYQYNMDQGQKDGTARKLDINVIHHRLDEHNKTVKAGSKAKPFMQTEASAYTYWDNQFKRSLYIDDEEVKSFKLRTTSHKRSRILYDAQSKIPIVKKILDTLNGKTIVFGNSVDSLLKVTPDVVSSRNTDKVNDDIRDRFDKGKINVIGSFKKLKQGANLDGLQNCVIMSYYSTEKDIIQRLGRLRKDGEKIGKVFIILTTGTKEEDWFSKMFENMDSFNMKHYLSIDDYLKKVK